MLNQKDNDFDDLFRRASDKYPLRTDSADWNRMAAALDDPSSALPEIQDTDKRRRRRFIWFFLLLPLGGVGYYAFHKAGIGHGHAVATESVVKAPASGAGANRAGTDGEGTSGASVSGEGTGADSVASGAGKGSSAADASGSGSGADGAGTVASGSGTSEAGTGAKGSVKTGGSVGDAGSGAGGAGTGGSGAGTVADGSGANEAGTGANGAGKNRKGGGSAVTPGVLTPVAGKSAAGKNIVENHRGKNGVGGIKDAASGGVVSGATNGVVGGATNGMVGGGRGAGNDKSVEASRVANYPVNRAHISKDYNLTVSVEAPVVAKDSSKVKPKASSKQKSSYLYAGLLAAPDLSTVKFQSTKGVGTTYSLLLGYQFNKRWAIESGVSLDRKRYYTDAEYFDAKNVHMYPNTTLNNVDGTCYMWEIPVNVRYNFSQTEKTKWFATAGLSTYFMTSEKYNYNFTNNTTGRSGDSYWDLKKPSQYWFSIINLSAGYEHSLGGIGNLRIEPYLRVPLSGLGTGKLNILSTGINIGITRRLW